MNDVRPIDANAVKKALTGWVDNPTDEEIEYEIDRQPTLDYEPVRHGKWIDNVDENGFLRNAWRKCSVCGGLNYSKKPSYCPSCGAKMDGGKKNV